MVVCMPSFGLQRGEKKRSVDAIIRTAKWADKRECRCHHSDHGEIINMERPRGVNCVKTAGGRTLCTLDRGKGLYG